ncbi:MAG: DPP IV N-terminal domain-containing protein [Gemmatimonadaceae bacterium]
MTDSCTRSTLLATTVTALAALLVTGSLLPAQGTRSDYVRAEQLISGNAAELVTNDAVRPRWMSGDRFWFRNRAAKGWEFVVVEMATGNRRPAFDHAKLAAALSVAADTAYDARRLPFREIAWVNGDRGIRFAVSKGKHWTCDVTTYVCTGPDSTALEKASEVTSPDGKWVAYERGGNLFVRGSAGGEEIALTNDGTADFGYALSNIGCCGQVTAVRNKTELRPFVLWSPDSRRIATHKWDQRNVRLMHLLETKNPGPILHSYRYALPGDSVIPRYDLHVFDVESRSGVKIDYPSMDVVNTTCCWLATDTVVKDVRWTAASDQIFFTAGTRGFDKLTLATADARTGAVRPVLTETSKTFVETNQNSGGIPNWRPLAGGKEVVWWSERDGWGHLYLVDAATGAIRNRITSGDWMVSDLLWVDEAQRYAYFTARGRAAEGRDPYFRQYYRAKLDGSSIESLTRDDADHDLALSPSGRYLVDVAARPDQPPVSTLRRVDGTVVREIQTADISRLVAAGYRAPEMFTVRARDGVNELRGLLWMPTNFDSTRSYPVIDYVYPGPQVGSVGSRQFASRPSGNANALAELGFIVVQVDALGTPGRSKAFHDAFYGNMGDNGLPDQMAAIKQLAARHPQMDLGRVGIFGHSGGGFASTDAILRYPDFFKVAVSSAGNHDNRSYDYTWGEKYQGLRTALSDSMDTFDSQSNWRLARNLRGKLFLMYGSLDDNVHPVATQLLIDELIKFNKDFDLLVMPNRNHGFAGEPYVVRRTWDYFVRHLLGVTPPEGYELRTPTSP